jgi:hypothetical protein
VYPDEERMETDAAVDMLPALDRTGTGMKANNATRQIAGWPWNDYDAAARGTLKEPT